MELEKKCTCRLTPQERCLNRDCPVHGDAEERRRHEAARQATRIQRATGLSPADVEVALRQVRRFSL